MIKCSNCQHENLPGALFCSECGARLIEREDLTTHAIKQSPSDVLSPELTPPVASQTVMPEVEAESVISLLISETGQVLHLASGLPGDAGCADVLRRHPGLRCHR